MDEKTTTFGLNRKQLAKLMKIGVIADSSCNEILHDQIKSRLLRDLLDKPLESDFFHVTIPAVEGEYFSYGSGELGLEPVGKILRDTEMDCSLLGKIKDYYNNLSRRDNYGNEHDIAITIYFAAIAAAMVIHDKKITSFSYESLENSFSSLASKSWMVSGLIILFRKGINVCRHACDVKEDSESKEHKE